jgi:hypothetical protein
MQAVDNHVPAVVVQRRDQPGQRGQRVRDGAAVRATVHRVIEGPDLDDEVDNSPQRCGKRGRAERPIGAIGQHDNVGPQQILVLFQKTAQVR